MTGKSEESEAGGDWLAPLFEQLKGAVQRAAAVLAKDDPEEKGDAETLARRAGVVARAALAVDAIRRRIKAGRRPEQDSEEDEMGGRLSKRSLALALPLLLPLTLALALFTSDRDRR
jgi:hypothetical protein